MSEEGANQNYYYNEEIEEDEEDEAFIGTEEEEIASFSVPDDFLNGDPGNASGREMITNIIRIFNSFVPDIVINFNLSNSISFYIPSSFLPVTLRVAYEFINSDHLLDVDFELNNFDWKVRPQYLNITSPFNQNYCGKSLVFQATDNFFTENFQPKENYRSAPFFLSASGRFEESVVSKLVDAGFSRMQAIRAASLCHNDYVQCVTYLQTGQYKQTAPFAINVSYRDCPLLYLILEIFDAILNLQDHCSICGRYTAPGLKPSICKDNQLCQYKFMELGLGTTISKEIRRDPFVADLLFSIFATTIKTNYFDPKPPMPKNKTLEELIDKMPSMKKIAKFEDDASLNQALGHEAVDLLRWVILTCRSNFFLLPPSLEFPQFRRANLNNNEFKCFQFMALTASPEQENIFQQLKKEFHGSRFLWHGSSADRWHSIIRQGLKNATGTKLQQNGAALGSGIYFAPESGTSIGYSRSLPNSYRNSYLCDNLQVIALCEVVNLPINKEVSVTVEIDSNDVTKKKTKTLKGSLNDHSWALTLTLEEACIVRFVFVNLKAQVNVSSNPPRNIPTMNQVLKLRANLT